MARRIPPPGRDTRRERFSGDNEGVSYRESQVAGYQAMLPKSLLCCLVKSVNNATVSRIQLGRSSAEV